MEAIESQPDLISDRTKVLAREARECVEMYAANLVESPVRERSVCDV